MNSWSVSEKDKEMDFPAYVFFTYTKVPSFGLICSKSQKKKKSELDAFLKMILNSYPTEHTQSVSHSDYAGITVAGPDISVTVQRKK